MEKKIYPDYDLQYDALGIGILSYIRKQNTSGTWYLIPVIKRWYFDMGKKIDMQEEVLNCLKSFHTDCYKVVLFYILQEDGLIDINGRPSIYLDSDQRSEKERLTIKPIKIEEHE